MVKIFIYGGCVVRDAYQAISEQVGSSGYVARQSLISAINAPAKLPEVDLGSPFQSRMLNGDIQSNLIHTVRRAAPSTDLLVMDFHVDRSGIFLNPDGSFLTPSRELTQSGALKGLRGVTRIELGSERHTRLWTTAAKRFVGRLEEYNLLEKSLVIDAPWAEQDEKGVPFGDHNGRPVREVSENISALTGILAGLGVNVVRMPSEVAEAPIVHKWGRGAYHFGPAAMGWVSNQMLEKINA